MFWNCGILEISGFLVIKQNNSGLDNHSIFCYNIDNFYLNSYVSGEGVDFLGGKYEDFKCL